jgi:hypothetical protein
MTDIPESKASFNSPAPSTMLRIAVFHRSEDVQEHVAPLRHVKGVELFLIWQGVTWMRPRGVDGVLWELSPEGRR